MENLAIGAIVVALAVAVFEFYHSSKFKAKVLALEAEAVAKWDALLAKLEKKTTPAPVVPVTTTAAVTK